MLTATLSPPKTMASVLAKAPNIRSGVIVAYQLVDSEEVQERTFLNVTMTMSREITAIFGDTMVAEMLVYSSGPHARAVNRILVNCPHRKFRRTRTKVARGRAWTFTFKN